MILGAVPYLNVQPMLWAVRQGMCGTDISIVPEVPRRLADSLSKGAYDTAIVPVFEYFRHPDLYSYIRGPVIATRGPVYSVMLYSSEPLEALREVYLDASSLTSVNLFRVIAAEKGLALTFIDAGQNAPPRPLPPGTGWVVIGDPAMAEAGRHPHTLDLGVAWRDLTGLPFIFAAWLVPHGVREPRMEDVLNKSLEIGLDNLEQVALDSSARYGVTPEFALLYFTQYIHYYFGDEELAGWKEFGRLCHKHGLIASIPEYRQYRGS